MDSLPENIVLHILQYTSWKELFFLQCANKRWNAALEKCWKPIVESFSHMKTDCWMHVGHLFEQDNNPNAFKEQIINPWGAVVKAYQKGYAWKGLSLQLPDTIEMGIYDYYNIRSPFLRQYANCSSPKELLIERQDYDPTLELDSSKVHTLWGKDVLISCMEPPFGCETFYVGREAWAKWFSLDGYILAVPILPQSYRDPERANIVRNEYIEKVRQFYADLSAPQVQDIGDNTHVRKEMRKEKENFKVPMVLVGYFTQLTPRIANDSHSQILIQLAEELKLPYLCLLFSFLGTGTFKFRI
eukprot:Phypoly_transcript_12253.p1 GENE.Phypoly_transcript_12253~~Phypoly_transcript_12253.p1  ORF type:complete len:307 (+),score=31.91 Phypoly_transcript_12253:22-921(+)